MKKIVIIYIALVIVVIILAAWRLGAFGFILGSGGDAEVTIGDETVSVDVADDDEERKKGLGGRESLDEEHGMLFVFEEKGIHSFWMLGMNFPIDIIFINDNKIVDMKTNVAPPEGNDINRAALPLYRPSEPVNYVLEVPAGYAKSSNWSIGDTVEISGL